jgi:hypothetical protein
MAKEPKKEKKPNPATRKRFIPSVPHNFGGRPPKEIDVDQVFKLAQTMLPIESVAMLVGCSKDTLYERFPDVLQKAREGRRQSLCMVMWEKALIEKDTKMMIWLSKQHLGYKDAQPEEASLVIFNVQINEVPI